MFHTVWTEAKAFCLQILPYAVIVWLIWSMQMQQQRLVDEQLRDVKAQLNNQFTVLSAVRDTLTQRGLVVPPLGETN
jgi:hypothetical protein|tara:strand:- start:270 stop:500 length:231 start_codon:yes stop_codon:yes gene_type:complete